MKKYLILENIRSVLNVGSIFRTADAIGIDKIYLCGITPAPVDRFGRTRNDLHKSALGAEKSVKWEQIDDIKKLIEELRESDFEIVALEQSRDSIDYKSFIPEKNVAIVLGNETDGVSLEVQKKSDVIVEIKMNGSKESLNVGVATGIILYRFFDS